MMKHSKKQSAPCGRTLPKATDDSDMAYAEKNAIPIVKHYIYRAISAKTDNRPEFQQMIKEMTEEYPLRGMYLGHFYFSVVSAGTTPYSSALTGSA
mgnify:CR=1 FL=1